MWNNSNPYGGGAPPSGNPYGASQMGIAGAPPPSGNPYGGAPSMSVGAPGNFGAPGGNFGGAQMGIAGVPPPSGNPYGGAPSMSVGVPGNFGAPGGNFGAPPPQNSYAPPQGGYGGAPQGGYGGAQGNFGAPPPQNSYGPPQGGYGAPQGNFGAPPPQNSYGPPQGGYGAPQGGYGPPQGGYAAVGGPGYTAQQGYGAPQGAYAQGGPNRGSGGSGGQKKAVLVGINYIRHQRGRLKGCINDVKNMQAFLSSRGFQNANVRVLTDDQSDPSKQPTKANILRDLRWLASTARPGDSLFFHYSGHGSQVADTNGDEDDGMDETILPVDYNTAGQIIDDTLHEILVAPLPAGCKLTSLMDCCHSGTGLDLPYVHNLPSSGSSYGGAGKKIKKKKKKKKKKNKKSSAPGELPGTSRADVYLYSGCRDDQTSADTSVDGEATGAMTWAFTSALQKNPNLSYYGILGAMRDVLNSGPRKYTQVPQLSTGRQSDLAQIFVV